MTTDVIVINAGPNRHDLDIHFVYDGDVTDDMIRNTVRVRPGERAHLHVKPGVSLMVVELPSA